MAVMILRREQIEQLQQAIDARQVEEFSRRLRKLHPQRTSGLSGEDLRWQVRSDIRTAIGLDITENHDLWRFVLLRYLPEEVLGSEYLLSVIFLILSRVEWDADKRFDFLERHVFSRSELAKGPVNDQAT